MNEQEFKHRLLHHLAETRVPARDHPWDAVEKRLHARRQARRTLRLAFAAGCVLAGVIFFLTPLGQAAAQSILSLFTRAESDVRPVPTDQQSAALVPSPTPVPTQMVALQAITPGSTFWTPTPAPTRESNGSLWGLTLSEAAALAQFEPLAPAEVLAGYSLADVVYNPDPATVTQIYKFTPYQAGEMFILSQRAALPDDAVGQSAEVETFWVGDVLVETVRGGWFAPAGAAVEQWENDIPVHAYRWQQNGYTFTLDFWVGDTFSPAYLTAVDRQAQIEVLLGARAALPERMNLNNLESIEAVRAVSEQPVLAPTLLPEGFIFGHGVYETGRVVLIYEPAAGTRYSGNASLTIFETPLNPGAAPLTYDNYPPGAVETVAIGPYSGTLVRGQMMDNVFDPDAGASLVWQTETLNINLWVRYSSTYAARLAPEDLITLAESME